jgi:hypothetical protein
VVETGAHGSDEKNTRKVFFYSACKNIAWGGHVACMKEWYIFALKSRG